MISEKTYLQLKDGRTLSMRQWKPGGIPTDRLFTAATSKDKQPDSAIASGNLADQEEQVCHPSAGSHELQKQGVVGIVHGMNEHSGRYDNVAAILLPHHWAVYGFDLPGHGESPGQRGHIGRWREYVESLQAFIETLHARHPDLPLFLYAHSMGALIALDCLSQPEDDKSLKNPAPSAGQQESSLAEQAPPVNGASAASLVAGIVLSGVPLVPTGPRHAFKELLARMLSQIWPAFSVAIDIDPSGISRDPDQVHLYLKDPLVTHRASARWAVEFLDALERVTHSIDNITTPVLFIHGESDPICAVSGSRMACEGVRSADKTLRTFSECRHEPHHDSDWHSILKDVRAWLDEHRQHTIEAFAKTDVTADNAHHF